MRQRVGIAATAAVLALVASAVGSVSAQSSSPTIRDGTYGGFIKYDAGLLVSQVGSSFVAADVTGFADFTVLDSVVSGSATLQADVDVSVGGATGSGGQTVTASISGSASSPSLNAGTPLPLRVTYAGCSQIWGTWNEEFAAAALSAGVEEVRWAYGSFNFQATGTTTSPEELAELQQQMGFLFDQAQFQMSEAEAAGPHNRIPDTVKNIIDEALRAQAELSIGSPCSNRRDGISDAQAEQFLSQLATLMHDFVTQMLKSPGFSPTADDWTSILGDLGRAGLLGSNSGDSARAAELTSQITDILEADLDLYVASGDLAEGTPEAVKTLRNALAVDPNMRAGAITAREAALVIGLVW